MKNDSIAMRMICTAATLLRNADIQQEQVQVELHSMARRLEEIGACEDPDLTRLLS